VCLDIPVSLRRSGRARGGSRGTRSGGLFRCLQGRRRFPAAVTRTWGNLGSAGGQVGGRMLLAHCSRRGGGSARGGRVTLLLVFRAGWGRR